MNAITPRRGREGKEDNKEKEFDKWGDCGGDSDGEVRRVGNHIYFYAPIMTKTVATLVDTLHTVSNDQRIQSVESGGEPQPIIIHFNSPGGSLYAGVAAMDAVRLCPVPIHSVVDGICASAATFPFMVAAKRIMPANSFMLIHQLSTGMWGKFYEILDDIKNAKQSMKLIRDIYIKHTKIPKGKLEKILKHDLWFSAKKCKKFGMVDEII